MIKALIILSHNPRQVRRVGSGHSPGPGAVCPPNALRIAELFDDPDWRVAALDITARAVASAGSGPVRVGLPAVLGLRDHARVLHDAIQRFGTPVIELPLVPPGIPGIRLHDVLRAKLRALGGRILVGERVARVEATNAARPFLARSAASRSTPASR